MLKHCTKDGKNPIYIVRYEDLCLNPVEELTGMMKFLLDLDDLTGTNMERRIQQLEKMGETVSTYGLKRSRNVFNASDHLYTPE